MQHKHILFIDDDADDLEIAGEALGIVSNQITFTSITSATRALEKLLAASESLPDMIFLDLNMPIMNGQDFLAQIKTIDLLKHIPVVILSTTSNASTIKLMKDMGANGFITKPSKFDEWVSVIKACVEN